MYVEDLYMREDFDPSSKEPINFVEDIFAYLSPFSAHRIEIWGEAFPTHEHAYQASRVKPGPERDEIKNAPSPKDAWRVGQKYKNDPNIVVADFNKDRVVEEIMRAKLTQHQDVKTILKASGDRELHKVYAPDTYWGMSKDGTKGENKMGKIWMKLREELKK